MTFADMLADIDLYNDKVRTARFNKNIHYVDAINIAIRQLIDDRYGNIKEQKNYSFQSSQKIRSDLRTIVVPITTGLIGNVIPYPADYMYEVGMKLIINGKDTPSRTASMNELDDLPVNSFEAPSEDYPVHYEDSNGINIDFGPVGSLTGYRMYYLRQPAKVFLDTNVIVTGPVVLTIGQSYFVNQGPVISNGITYQQNQEFIAASTAFTGAGTVSPVIDSDLPETTHKEICQRAARILQGSVENFPKMQQIDSQQSKA